MIKKIIKHSLNKIGYKIEKVTNTKLKPVGNNFFTMKAALERCVVRGLKVNTVIDVGASDGSWSKACMKTISRANYFLVEAQSGHLESLNSFKRDYLNVDYILAAAGKNDGFIYFDNSSLFGGLASENKSDKNSVKVPVVSLDSEIKKRHLEPPFLLKLDTHGFEVPILEGAKELLKKAELVIIETYNYNLTNDSLKYYEMCSYMEDLGFESIEMVDFMLREYDQSFWQMDTFFVPKINKEFKYNSYK